VAATKAWPGKITVPADRKPVFPEESLGLRARAQRAVIYQLLVDGMKLNLEHGVFQKLPFLFSIGLKGGVTPVEQTTDQDDYLWDFTPSLSASNTPKSGTIEFGDDTQAYEVECCMAKSIKISGVIGDNAPVKIEADLFGKQITPTTFTSSLAVAQDEAMIANLTKLFIDDASDGFGGTQVTDLLREYSVEILTGLHPKFFANGQKTFNGHGEGFIDVMATFTFEGNSGADAQFDLFQAGSSRAIRLLIEGSQIGSGENHSLKLDMWGTWEEIIPLGNEKEGNNLHTAVFHCHTEPEVTPAFKLGVNVITNVSAV
jgi:hypothetical protein